MDGLAALPSGHQQLIGVINPAKSICRSTQIGMMHLDQRPECLLDGFLGGIRLQPENRQRFGTRVTRSSTPLLAWLSIRRSLITTCSPTAAACLAMILALPMTVTEFRHHPAWILIKPFTGPHPIEGKRRQHRRGFLRGLSPHGSQQISAKTTHHPVKPLAQAELRVKAAAIELVDQLLKAVLAQRTPTRLHRQRISPALHLRRVHQSRWLLPVPITVRITLRSLPLLPLQTIKLLMQSLHLPAQSIVFPQQSFHIAGDTFSVVLPVAIVTG